MSLSIFSHSLSSLFSVLSFVDPKLRWPLRDSLECLMHNLNGEGLPTINRWLRVRGVNSRRGLPHNQRIRKVQFRTRIERYWSLSGFRLFLSIRTRTPSFDCHTCHDSWCRRGFSSPDFFTTFSVFCTVDVFHCSHRVLRGVFRDDNGIRREMVDFLPRLSCLVVKFDDVFPRLYITSDIPFLCLIYVSTGFLCFHLPL